MGSGDPMRVLILSLIAALSLTVAAATQQKDPPPGKAPFERVCAACHGEQAEGGQGPKIAGLTLEYDDFLAQVRHPDGEMPAIPKTEMSDDEVKEVFEYLKSL